jgi:hypothetical protein
MCSSPIFVYIFTDEKRVQIRPQAILNPKYENQIPDLVCLTGGAQVQGSAGGG